MPKKSSAPGLSMLEAQELVLSVVSASTEPLTATQISKKIIGPQKLTPARVEPILDELKTAERLFAFEPSKPKGKSRYWDRSLSNVIRSALQQLSLDMPEPLTVKEISGKIASTIKCTEAELVTPIQEMIAAGVMFSIPPKTASGKPRFWSRGIDDFIQVSLLKIIDAKGPQASATIQKGIKGITASQFQSVLQKLIDQRQVFEHPGIGKKKSVALFARHPVRPEPYLNEIQTALANVVSQLTAVHVTPETLRRTIVQMVEAAGVTFGGASPNGQKGQFAESPIDLIALMHCVEPAADQGVLIPPSKLRRAANRPKQEFDQTVLQLASEGRISLHRHDFVSSLSEAERADLVTDGNGSFYVGLALRPKLDVQE